MATNKRSAQPTRRPTARPAATQRKPAKPPETFWSIQAKERSKPPRVTMIGGGGIA